MENSEDVYEFKCKDENRVEEEEEDKGANPARPDGAPAEEKADKRTRDPETDDDEEARKKRRLETKEAPKGIGRGGSRPTGIILAYLLLLLLLLLSLLFGYCLEQRKFVK